MTVSEASEVQGERWIVRNGEIRTDGPPYHCVASITITNNDVEHADARARLIAAAPDLLKALEFIRDGYDNQDVNHVDFRVKAYQVALEAIDRARTSTRKDERA